MKTPTLNEIDQIDFQILEIDKKLAKLQKEEIAILSMVNK